MDILNKEFIELILSFNRNHLRYLLVGGFAVNHYGYSRSTGDIDFWIEDSIENRNNLRNSFKDLEFGDFAELTRIPLLPGYCEILLDSGIYADILGEIHGFKNAEFSKCYDEAEEHEIQNAKIRYISYNHLLQSKSQSQRPKDIIDVQELKKANKS